MCLCPTSDSHIQHPAVLRWVLMTTSSSFCPSVYTFMFLFSPSFNIKDQVLRGLFCTQVTFHRPF